MGITNAENADQFSQDILIQEIERLLKNSFAMVDSKKNQNFKAVFSEDEDMTLMFNQNI